MDLKYSVISNYFKDSTTLIEAAKHVNDGDMFCESKFEEETLHGTVDAFGQEYKVEIKFSPTDPLSISLAVCECERKKCLHIAAVLLQQATTDTGNCINVSVPIAVTEVLLKQDYDFDNMEHNYDEFVDDNKDFLKHVKIEEIEDQVTVDAAQCSKSISGSPADRKRLTQMTPEETKRDQRNKRARERRIEQQIKLSPEELAQQNAKLKNQNKAKALLTPEELKERNAKRSKRERERYLKRQAEMNPEELARRAAERCKRERERRLKRQAEMSPEELAHRAAERCRREKENRIKRRAKLSSEELAKRAAKKNDHNRKRYRNLKAENRLNRKTGPREKRPCDICGKFISVDNLKTHIGRHNNLRTYKCSHCEKTFATKSCLTIHEKRRHYNVRPHLCSVCGAAKATQTELTLHMDVHNDSKNYKCEDCSKSFRTYGGLYQHRHRCHPYVRGNKLICPICPKTFDQESALLAHKVQHKKTIQRSKHKCIVCSATFSQKQYLQVHCKRKHDASGNNSFDKTNKLNNETDDVLSC